MARVLMTAAVDRRFGITKTPHKLEWFSDNGSVRSPERNGMSESFVKTLKRDYARVTILPDAATILAKLPDWIEDYCEVHPHSGLKIRSPREFMRLSA